MKADLDFDIVAHLGFVRNVDLLNKGIYVVQIRLYYEVEGKLVAPVGMFSSPSSVGSEVQSQELPPSPICSMCEVDDFNRAFRTRSLIVRYKNEKYELNDGVHWRLTLPACNLPESTDEPSDSNWGPKCSQLLHMKFDLLYAPFKEEDPALPKVDLMRDVHKLIPDDPVYSIVATQNIIIENASSGIHSYYPVHFNGSYITELDCMIHCAITGIRYPDLAPKPLTSPVALAQAYGDDIPTPDAAGPDSDTAGDAVGKEGSSGVNNDTTTPVKIRPVTSDLPSRPLPSTPHTPPITAAANYVGNFTTPGKDTGASKRYVPVLSPHSTVMAATPTQPVEASTPGSAMNRLSRNMGAWRRSVTAGLASPVPLMDKLSTIGATSTRRLSALTSVLSSPLGEAAAMFRTDSTPAGPLISEAEVPRENLVSGDGGDGNLAGDLMAESAPKAASSSGAEKEESVEQALKNRAEQQIDAAELLTHRFDPLLDPERWMQLYAAPVINNYASACLGMAQVLNLYYHVQDTEEAAGGSAAQSQLQVKAERTALKPVCELETSRTAILAEISLCEDETERVAILKEKVDLCNLQLTLHWSLLMTALRRVMLKLCPVMKAQYVADAKRFWRGQLLVQTKSFTQTANYRPAEIQLLLEIVDSQIKREEAMMNSKRTNIDGDAATSTEFRRNMQIFDADLHMKISKLPHMVVQQYVGTRTSTAKPSIAELNSKLRAGNKPTDSVASADQPVSALLLALKAVEEVKSPEGAYPAGTVYLARGGQVLDELTLVDRNLGLLDGEGVDLSGYPQLAPLSVKAKTAGTSVEDTSKESETTQLDTKNIELDFSDAIAHESTADQAGDIDSPAEAGVSAEMRTSDPEPASADGPLAFPVVSQPSAANAHSKLSSQLNWSDAFKIPSEAASTNTVHLVVLQHGFLGLSYDMQLIENSLRLEMAGSVEIFLATSNEGREQDSIAQMGKRLAFELLQHCKEYHPSLLKIGSKSKLSFIGHSMGGLIIRAALQEGTLKPVLSKLHTFVSLATPHVGSLFPSSQIVSTGMWALFKWKKYKALKELVLEDSLVGKAKKTFLYKLSENGVLSHFNKVVLVSSPKDQYVPSYSARIQTCLKSETDATLGVTVSEMVQNILEPLRADQIVRITMDNNVGETVDVNALIGRKAHICYLENSVAAAILVQAVKPYFLVNL